MTTVTATPSKTSNALYFIGIIVMLLFFPAIFGWLGWVSKQVNEVKFAASVEKCAFLYESWQGPTTDRSVQAGELFKNKLVCSDEVKLKVLEGTWK